MLRKEPFTGTVFVFRSRRADRLKLLYGGGARLMIAYKRLEETSFIWPAIKDGVMAPNHAQFEALIAGLDWRRVKAPQTRPPAAAEGINRCLLCVFAGASSYPQVMIATPSIDLCTIPAAQRAVVTSSMEAIAALQDITQRQQHLIAEPNHALHGKRSEKLIEDEQQMALEGLSIALAEVEVQKDHLAADTSDKAATKPTPKRTIGNHGLWAALMVLNAMRGLTMALRYSKAEAAAAP